MTELRRNIDLNFVLLVLQHKHPPLFCGSNRRRLELASVPCGGTVNHSIFQGGGVKGDVGRIHTVKRHPLFTRYSTRRTVNYLSESEWEELLGLERKCSFPVSTRHGSCCHYLNMLISIVTIIGNPTITRHVLQLVKNYGFFALWYFHSREQKFPVGNIRS